MKFEQYLEKRSEYEQFAETVARLVELAIEQHPGDFEPQDVQHRAKCAKKLLAKLDDRKLTDADDIEQHINDLAGCRLVFYTNGDVTSFLHSGILSDNFNIDWDRSNFHHPSDQTDDPNSQYRAIHYVIALKPERLNLPEYNKFDGLSCEIQVQTILNHAWSETAHDITYKPPDLKGFGGRDFASIEKRLAKIMTDYLLPAGHEFDKVKRDFDRLMQGKELFDAGALAAIIGCANNNDRYDLINRFKEDVLPRYDDVTAEYPDILRSLQQAIEAARKTPTRPIQVPPYGQMPGHSADDVTLAALEVLDQVRYVDATRTISLLATLYASAQTDKQRELLRNSAEHLAEHNVHVWRQVGPRVQTLVVAYLSQLHKDEWEPLRGIIVPVCSKVLSSQVQGTTSSIDTVTFHRGSVAPSPELERLRLKAIDILEKLYSESTSHQHKREIVSALSTATRYSGARSANINLDRIVLSNAKKIADFYATIADSESYELLQHIEHKLLWLHRSHSKWQRTEGFPVELKGDVEQLLSSILAFRDAANRSEDFGIYKVLVGFQSVFPDAWANDESDYEEEEAYRDRKIEEFISSVDQQNETKWTDIIKRCASTKSNDLATFPKFGEFLRKLGQAKPCFVLLLAQNLDEHTSQFLPAILGGLWYGCKQADARTLVESWINNGQHLQAIARHLRLVEPIEAELLAQATKKAIELEQPIAVIEAITAALAGFTEEHQEVIENVYEPAIGFLADQKDGRWPQVAWVFAKKSALFSVLNDEQISLTLGSLTFAPEIDYPLEGVLTELAQVSPEMVLRFFGIRFEQASEQKEDDDYEAIPYDFDTLAKPLSLDPNLAINIVREWHDPDDIMFEFRGARLLAIIFPGFPDSFSAKLRELVASGDSKDVDFVLRILRNYEGQTFLHETCKDIVGALSNEDQRLNLVSIILDQTGVVNGELGFVEAYKRKKAEILPWLSDPREEVRIFAERHLKSLDRQIAAEQRSLEERREQRRRDWEPPNNDNN